MSHLQIVPAAPAAVFCPDGPGVTEALVFFLDGQEYGIALQCVQEIRSYQRPTRLAGARDDVLGVIDLRGEIVPLVDLRRRLGLVAADVDPFTVVIVISLMDRRIGVVADRVNDVVALSPQQIRAMPPLCGGAGQHHLVAIASLDARSVLLMDIEALLAEIRVAAPLDLAA
ncbi:MAG: chemotaxis protein CheW [Roseateles sp.]|uniref:chemotaxis protein CheW n=1 Tax=Roseateles sp. TaxID=1971397 RepID=UPI00403600D3